MMEGILPQEQLTLLRPELVSPAVLALVSEDAPNRAILCAGAGGFEIANITLTEGIHIAEDPPSADPPGPLDGSRGSEGRGRAKSRLRSKPMRVEKSRFWSLAVSGRLNGTIVAVAPFCRVGNRTAFGALSTSRRGPGRTLRTNGTCGVTLTNSS
jgi:hypothetical protein